MFLLSGRKNNVDFFLLLAEKVYLLFLVAPNTLLNCQSCPCKRDFSTWSVLYGAIIVLLHYPMDSV